MWATNGVRLTIQIRLTGISLLHGELHADVGSLCSKQQCCNERFASRGNRRYSSIMLPGIYICPSHYARAIIGHIYMPSAVGGLNQMPTGNVVANSRALRHIKVKSRHWPHGEGSEGLRSRIRCGSGSGYVATPSRKDWN